MPVTVNVAKAHWGKISTGFLQSQQVQVSCDWTVDTSCNPSADLTKYLLSGPNSDSEKQKRRRKKSNKNTKPALTIGLPTFVNGLQASGALGCSNAINTRKMRDEVWLIYFLFHSHRIDRCFIWPLITYFITRNVKKIGKFFPPTRLFYPTLKYSWYPSFEERNYINSIPERCHMCCRH